jgi:hypothetical protein
LPPAAKISPTGWQLCAASGLASWSYVVSNGGRFGSVGGEHPAPTRGWWPGTRLLQSDRARIPNTKAWLGLSRDWNIARQTQAGGAQACTVSARSAKVQMETRQTDRPFQVSMRCILSTVGWSRL